MMRVKEMMSVLLGACILLQGSAFSEPDSLAQQTAKDFTAVAKKAIPAVVSIKVKAKENGKNVGDDDINDLFNDEFFHRFFSIPKRNKANEEQIIGQASGFIVSADGYILTNTHVIDNATEILVTLNDGHEFTGKVVGKDSNTDIAIVKIEGNNFPYLKLGDSDKLEIGEWVIAVGNPMGLQASLTVGVVSALGRNNLDLTNVEDFIQTDAAINRGNSGGPLLDLDSQVIGMNTAIVTNTSLGYMGIGFAIPSNMIKLVMDQIVKNGSVTRGFIGVTLQTIDKDLAQAFNTEQLNGALISSISKDSPAEKAGLKQGDIIRAYNGQKVTNIASLRNAIALMSPGTRIKLTVLREGKTIELPVDVGSYPTSQPREVSMSGNKLGFEVQDLTPEVARSLGLTDESGVVISKVEPGSPAAWVGLKKGTLIMAVNQQKVENTKDFSKVLENISIGKPVLLLIKQGDTVRYISLSVK